MSWRIEYSDHLKHRIKIRELPYGLARDILIFAVERYYDKITHHFIAVGKSKYKGKEREFAVAYREDQSNEIVKVITIHPLKTKQKENRIKSGRWQKL